MSFDKVNSFSCNKFQTKIFELTLFGLENFDVFIDRNEFSTQQTRKTNANKSARKDGF